MERLLSGFLIKEPSLRTASAYRDAPISAFLRSALFIRGIDGIQNLASPNIKDEICAGVFIGQLFHAFVCSSQLLQGLDPNCLLVGRTGVRS
jgi:hypothetical protein